MNSSRITKDQIRKLHTLLRQVPELYDMRRDLYFQYSDGRTDSSRELTNVEVHKLIQFLESNNPCTRMRNKILAIAYDLGWSENRSEDDLKMNSARVDAFLLKRGAVRKSIWKCNKSELAKVVTQFVKMKEQGIQHDVRSILKELGIPVDSESSNTTPSEKMNSSNKQLKDSNL